MFRLRSSLHKYFRGVKVLCEVAYVSIGDYTWTINGDESTKTVEATIVITRKNESFYLSIPDDKLDSVIDRLVALRDKRKRG